MFTNRHSRSPSPAFFGSSSLSVSKAFHAIKLGVPSSVVIINCTDIQFCLVLRPLRTSHVFLLSFVDGSKTLLHSQAAPNVQHLSIHVHVGYFVRKSAEFYVSCVIVVMSSALRQLARRAAPQFAALRGGNAPAHGAKSSFNLSYI